MASIAQGVEEIVITSEKIKAMTEQAVHRLKIEL
jgi:hypothetical protein